MKTRNAISGVTLIELLAVIGLIVVLIALTLPNFVTMMTGRRWSAAVGNIQIMVMRARALATNVRLDVAVEFDIQADNGTSMWLESESNVVETLDDLNNTYNSLGGGEPGSLALQYLTDWDTGVWYHAGGRQEGGKRPYVYHPDLTDATKYGDNARQSEVVKLASRITIDPSPEASPNFVSWDMLSLPDGTKRLYGGDDHKDIRLGPHGALVQTRSPILCLTATDSRDRRRITVVRCTGRAVTVR
jgi:Tfp pilus assembly protein FimT